MAKKYNEEQIEQMHALVSEMTQAKAAEIIGCTIKTIQRYTVAGAREKDYASNAKYHDAHTEEIKAYKAQYGRDNRDALNAKSLAWNKAHPEARKATMRRDYENNKERFNAADAKRRALIKGATIGNLEEIKEIYRQAREDEPIRCYLCGELIPLGDRHVDHKYPLSKGGDHTPSNLGMTHSMCNFIKNDSVLDSDMA